MHSSLPRTIQAIVLLCVFFTAPFTLPATGQSASPTPVTLGVQTSIHSTIMGEDRTLLIYTPDGYEQSTADYPVIYLLDGDGHFLHTAGITQFLANNGKMPEVIIIGIPNTDRTRDLTPALSTPDERFPTAGGADRFLTFISDELVPYVESNYRTAPYRILIGHSFGGLFSVNALLQKPDLFKAHIAISPSLWWDEKGLLPRAQAFFNEHMGLRGFFYMTMGNEGGAMLAGAWGLAGIMEEKGPPFFKWHFELMDKETHGSIPHRATYNGLEMLYNGWSMDNFFNTVVLKGLSAVDEHYAALSTRFGYKITSSEAIVNQAGYILLGEDKIEEAIAAFERNINEFPESANVYDSAGDGYKARGDLKKAASSYAKACTMGKASHHPNSTFYCNNAAQVKG